MAGLDEKTVLPPKNTQELASVEAMLLQGPVALVDAEGHRAELPREVADALGRLVAALRRGQAITVAPLAMRLTTQEAADLLGVSRPTLIKLLEDGKIPYETPNRHRRIRLSDLLTYQAIRREERRTALGELSRESQEGGMYEEPAETYQAALKEARAKLA